MLTRGQTIARLYREGLAPERIDELLSDLDDMLTFQPELAQISAEVKPVAKGGGL